jgi:hypothetical protein
MSKHELSEHDDQPIEIRITTIPRGNKPAAKRCAQMTAKALRETSNAAKRGYVAAAQWFSLADKDGR